MSTTYDGPPLLEQMAKHSEHLWVLLHDERGVIRGVPIYEPVSYRELAVRGFMVPTFTVTVDGVWEYRPSRSEAEWRADLDLDQRRGAPCMKAYPKPLGTFTPRRRQVLSVEEITSMFGDIAA